MSQEKAFITTISQGWEEKQERKESILYKKWQSSDSKYHISITDSYNIKQVRDSKQHTASRRYSNFQIASSRLQV